MSASPLFDVAPVTDARTAPRHRVRLWAQLRHGTAFEGDVVVHDLSSRGFRVEAAFAVEPGDRIQLRIANRVPLTGIISHVSPTGAGCQFVPPLASADLADILQDGPFASARPASVVEDILDPVIPVWPGWVRAAILTAGVSLGWGGILALVTLAAR